MHKYFSDKYNSKMVELKNYVDEISKVTYECTTLHIIVSLSKRVAEIESILDLVSEADKASLIYTQAELFKINEQLSKNIPYKVGYGKKAVKKGGLLKEIERGNYDNALRIVRNLADIQPITISEELETITKICFNEDIHAVKRAFINSWVYKDDKAKKIVKCSRPQCGNEYNANLYHDEQFCDCGGALYLLKELENSEANYIPLYAKYILGYVKEYKKNY